MHDFKVRYICTPAQVFKKFQKADMGLHIQLGLEF